MYESDFIEHFKKTPVFSLSDANQIIKNKNYSKKFLKKMIEQGKVFRIKRGFYTLYDDPFLVSTFIKMPGYISGVSALTYHRKITQIPKSVFCITLKKSSKEFFMEEIIFNQTRHFFGYNTEDYEGFKIPIADVEKAIIDSLGKVPIHVIEEAISEINKEKMISYLSKIKESKIVKRMGYLMEHYNIDIYNEVKEFINYKYIYLDPLGNRKGIKNKKWGLIINI